MTWEQMEARRKRAVDYTVLAVAAIALVIILAVGHDVRWGVLGIAASLLFHFSGN